MENTIFIVLFIGGLLVFMNSIGVNVVQLVFNFVIRCLLGLILIYVANSAIAYYGGNLSVSINEITIGVSGILGIWGVFFMYCLQYYLTIT